MTHSHPGPPLTLTLPADPSPFDLAWFAIACQTAAALYGPPTRIVAHPSTDKASR